MNPPRRQKLTAAGRSTSRSSPIDEGFGVVGVCVLESDSSPDLRSGGMGSSSALFGPSVFLITGGPTELLLLLLVDDMDDEANAGGGGGGKTSSSGGRRDPMEVGFEEDVRAGGGGGSISSVAIPFAFFKSSSLSPSVSVIGCCAVSGLSRVGLRVLARKLCCCQSRRGYAHANDCAESGMFAWARAATELTAHD